MKIKNTFVLLDYDGVVSDSETTMRQIFNRFCTEYSIKPRLTAPEFASLFDEDVTQILLKETGNFEMLANFLGRMVHEISAVYPTIKIIPGMEAILKRHKTSLNLSIISSNFSEVIRNHLNQYNIDWDERRIIGFETGITKEVYLKSLREQNSNKDILIIGDTRGDIRAGKKADVLTGAVSWGYCNMEELRAENPDYFFETPESLGRTLDEIL